jgi:hypothetical protein
MSRLTPSPIGAELLDDPGADPATVARSLSNIARANRWFGGWAAVRHGLLLLLRGHPGPRVRPLVLLDIGTGLGDIPDMLQWWGDTHGLAIHPIGLERSPVAAQLARGRGLPVVLACGGDLPLARGAVDVVVVSQLAHHLDHPSCVRLFRECGRVARLGVVVADLARVPPVGPLFRLGGRLLGFDPVTLADGVTSLRRGFTAPELARLVAEAGGIATVDRVRGVRLVAVWSTAS